MTKTLKAAYILDSSQFGSGTPTIYIAKTHNRVTTTVSPITGKYNVYSKVTCVRLFDTKMFSICTCQVRVFYRK